MVIMITLTTMMATDIPTDITDMITIAGLGNTIGGVNIMREASIMGSVNTMRERSITIVIK